MENVYAISENDVFGFLSYRESIINIVRRVKPSYCSGSMPILYRYRSISEYSIDDFLNNSVYCAPVFELNDILDSSISIFESLRIKHPNVYLKLFDPRSISNKDSFLSAFIDDSLGFEFRGLLAYVRRHVRSVSFCEVGNSLSMWDRYADKCSGFCLKYDFSDDAIMSNWLMPVVYGRCNRFIYDSDVRSLDDLNFLCLFASLFKRSDWRYEKEWRMSRVVGNDGVRCELLNTYPSEICFGPKFDRSLLYKKFGRDVFLDICDFCEKHSIGMKRLVFNRDSSNKHGRLSWKEYF